MTNLTEQLLTVLKANPFSYSPVISRSRAIKAPKLPLITLTEISNIPRSMIVKIEFDSLITFQFDIFARDMILDGEVVLADTINETLALELNTVLTEQIGFTRVSSPLGNISNIDPSVKRYCVRYRVVYNNASGYCYR